MAALRAMSAADATVLPDGQRRGTPATDIDPGYIIVIEEATPFQPTDAWSNRSHFILRKRR